MGLFTRKKKAVAVEERDWLSDGWATTTQQIFNRGPYGSTAGPFVDISSTSGLATAGAAFKLISETIGMMPLKVYRGEKPEQAEARET